MDGHPELGTIKKVATKAQVGFGTVRRAKNGDGNTTVQNLDAIAKAFKKRPEDLLTLDHSPSSNVASFQACEPDIAPYVSPETTELLALVNGMDSKGINLLLVMARALAVEHPNGNRAAG
jgi:hypothetical protein